MAPAVAASGASSPVAIPMRATPTVPAEPHDVPVMTETIAEMTKAMRTMNCALMSPSP